MAEAKNCPMCGKAPRVWTIKMPGINEVRATCTTWDCGMARGTWTLDLWNRRDGEEEMLKEAKDTILDLERKLAAAKKSAYELYCGIIPAVKLLEALRMDNGVGKILSESEKDIFRTVEGNLDELMRKFSAELDASEVV